MHSTKCRCLCALAVLSMAMTNRVVEVRMSQLQATNFTDKLAKKDSFSLHGESSVLVKMGSAVCSADEKNPVKRYTEKTAALKEGAAKIREMQGLTGQTLKLMYELTQRFRDFESCTKVLVNPAGQNAQLLAAMKGGVADTGSLMNVMTGALADLSAGIKNLGYFKNEGVCGFYPENIDFQEAFNTGSPEKALDQQLFGTHCGVLDGVVYTGNLGTQEKKMIHKMGASIRGLVQVSKGKKGDNASKREEQIQAIENKAKIVIHEPLPIDNIEQEIGTAEDIDAIFEKWSQKQSSLLEFSESEDSEQQEIFAMIVFIGLMCIGLAIIIWGVAPMAADVR